MLKFLACASALALAAPVVAQDSPDTPMADPVVESDAAIDASTDAPLESAVGVDAETDVQTSLPEPAASADAQTEVTTDIGDTTTEVDAGMATDTPATEPEANVAATAQPTTDAPAAAEAASTTEGAATVTAEANDPAQVEAYVNSEFATRDGDGDGELTQDEFANWILPIFTAQLQQQMTQTEIDAWAEAAFAQTDSDQSNGVSSAELQAFLAA